MCTILPIVVVFPFETFGPDALHNLYVGHPRYETHNLKNETRCLLVSTVVLMLPASDITLMQYGFEFLGHETEYQYVSIHHKL